MRIFSFLIFALLISVTIPACGPGSTSQGYQESGSDVVPEFTETPSPTREESPLPTVSPPATLTSIPEPTQIVGSQTSTPITEETSATNTAIPSATATFVPTELLRGSFYGVDENHLGTGNAIIIQTQADEYSLNLENFEVTNGPGLHVILAEDNNPYNIATLGDYVDLGDLKTTSGDQMYPIPNNVDLEKYGSVVIYCLPFEAIFAIAPIR